MAKDKKESKNKLTVKQENFCNFYIETGNASVAYRKAYSCDKMKDKTVNERASRLLKEYKISTRVEKLQRELQDRSDMTKDEAVKFLSHVVRANILDYVDIESGVVVKANTEKEEVSINEGVQIVTVKDLSKLTIEQQRCIKSISQTKFGIRLELCDKDSALTRLASMLGWNEAVKQDVKTQLTIFELPDNGRNNNK